ncbi:acyl-CoA synthetase short-chain family member 3, mitochondrial isoform X1 [Myzus persicae]|uniref:acyl-CoA synthetase short-chain family member 3, mitochondrial isoform X1 n=2 Tax=Myzus persicae TaxID=13164 RepID=UPI000B93A045|nr:acyl-CoA synthetase short-chain family member 3, mitochondrial isoform X1 [Myzus persicae]XP_022172667.1 acyl-CoA synthetase short-chain family member 3, mitochondrial isoform X1 [Myzus persicae]
MRYRVCSNLVNNNYVDNNMVPNRNKSLLVNRNVIKTENYEEAYRRSLEDPEGFWAEVGAVVDWYKPWDKVLDNSAQPLTDWFVGGQINACYNAVDRHIKAGKGKKVALIHDSPVTKSVTKITYEDLFEKVSLLAGALVNLGVVKGDRVLIYMPLIPEAIISMLAVVRIGAVHSVVFGGFAARELCARINHATPKVIIAANCGIEPNKIVRYKDILNTALDRVTEKPKHCIIYQRPNMEPSPLTPGIDILWSDALLTAKHHPCVPVEANHPLYILYTSGTTDKPKGIVRPTGGHIATLCWTMSCIYGMTEDDVWWTASDMGWVVGHSYICYGPLCAGITSVMYEGKPDRTPDPGQYFRVIQDHKVNGLFTAPTALRVIRREDPVLEFGSKYNTKSLRTLFVAGEHCDHETLAWAGKVLNVPVLNHWWQTETGHSITATCLGFGHNLKPPMFSAGMPFPGYDVRILKEDGSPCQLLELGRIVVKLPLPPGVMSCLYNAPERFINTYFNNFIGYYDTMDAGYTDENGYIYVTARDDDVINVAGHRLSTSALEDVILSHPDVGDAAVFGVPETTKGEIPLCLYIKNKNCSKKEEDINNEIVQNVRDLIGPIASFHLCAPVKGLPRTRSGKTARKSLSNLASGKRVIISGTIEDPSVYLNIKQVLQKLGYAKNAPDPEIEK